ncbi:MAG TPA: LLM class flavin-dependent oxidoreductase, partial [Jatrophihabitans sp.]|nr:LLM class flavin-dependent oxidoreductase [Jatrophihabitans sp.]
MTPADSPRVSVMLPVQPLNLGSVLPFARLAAQTHSERLWSGQSMGIETHAIFAALAGAGMGLEYGSAVTLMPLRHPYTAALTARSIASLSGRPYISGIGPAAVSMQRRTLGAPYVAQLAATGEYLTIMRSLLDGKPTTSHGLWPVDEMGLPEVAAPPVELALGVLRPGMATLAGSVADRAITWLAPRSYIRDTLRPALAEAAAAAGRPRPKITSVLHCVLDRPGRDVGLAARLACELHV